GLDRVAGKGATIDETLISDRREQSGKVLVTGEWRADRAKISVQAELDLCDERLPREVVVKQFEGGLDVVRMPREMLRQIPQVVGKESAGVTPEKQGKGNGDAAKGPQLVKQCRHKLRTARMPYGNDEGGVVRVLLGGVLRRKYGKSIDGCSPCAGIVVGKGDGLEIGAREAPKDGAAKWPAPKMTIRRRPLTALSNALCWRTRAAAGVSRSNSSSCWRAVFMKPRIQIASVVYLRWRIAE